MSDDPVCSCNVRGGWLKGHGPDPARCPIHGEPKAYDRDRNREAGS